MADKRKYFIHQTVSGGIQVPFNGNSIAVVPLVEIHGPYYDYDEVVTALSRLAEETKGIYNMLRVEAKVIGQ